MNAKVRWTTAAAVLSLVMAACSSGGSSGSSATNATTSSSSSPGSTSATTAGAPKLAILVTNDDGYAAPGIDTMVQALLKLPNVTVTVVAPLKNQSGVGGKATSGDLTATAVKTAGGYAATAVAGYPADAVRYALETVLPAPPDLVVSGINFGQNIGPLIAISGTVGAAKAAATAGVPAIAVSSGLASRVDYPSAARIAISYITSHRDDFGAKSSGKADVININVPSCATGSVRGVKQVPAATDLAGRNANKVDCTSTATAPKDDVDAFLDGFAAITELDAAGTTVTATTAWAG